ncbi:hypothetical protein KJ966_04980 [bacterium]|nr:hypothetical protein [bacterium]
MSEISNLYTSNQTIYRTNSKSSSSRGKNGDIKHIVFQDGEPVMTEIIKVSTDPDDTQKKDHNQSPRRIKDRASGNKEKRSSEEVLQRKKRKLSERLKMAVQKSQTLWSEKEGIWLSYQGSTGFLVKLFDDADRCTSSTLMTQNQIIESTIPGLLDAGWKII